MRVCFSRVTMIMDNSKDAGLVEVVKESVVSGSLIAFANPVAFHEKVRPRIAYDRATNQR